MGFLNKFLDSMKLNEEDDYDYEDDYEDDEVDDEDEEEEEEKPKKSFFHREKKAPVEKAEPEERMEEPEPESEPEPEPVRNSRTAKGGNVVPMRSTGKNMEVCMIKPSTLNDARDICDTLLNGCAVVINMEGIPTETAQKIIDFTSGACYATKGNMQKISNYIFIATPVSINLSGDFQDIMGGGNGFE